MLNLKSFIKYGSNNHNGIFKIAYKSNKEKKRGPCVLPIKIFPQLCNSCSETTQNVSCS